MEEKSKTQLAYEYIVKKGSARQKEIAAEIGSSPSNIGVLLKPLVERGELAMCKVTVPGTPAQNEYRPGAGMPDAFRPLKQRQQFRIKPPKEDMAPTAAISARTRDPIETLADAIAAADPEPANERSPAPAKLELSEVAKQGLKEISARLAAAESKARPEPGLRCGTKFVMGEPEPMEFAMWENGRLDIYDGDELFTIPAADVIRLRRFLGCFTEEAKG